MFPFGNDLRAIIKFYSEASVTPPICTSHRNDRGPRKINAKSIDAIKRRSASREIPLSDIRGNLLCKFPGFYRRLRIFIPLPLEPVQFSKRFALISLLSDMSFRLADLLRDFADFASARKQRVGSVQKGSRAYSLFSTLPMFIDDYNFRLKIRQEKKMGKKI